MSIILMLGGIELLKTIFNYACSHSVDDDKYDVGRYIGVNF
jgi:hypothetical protein